MYYKLFQILWTVAYQAPLRFFRHECWSGLPFPPPGDCLDPGIKPESPALAGGFLTSEPPGKPPIGPCGGGLVTKSCPTLVTPQTVAHQAPPSMRFSRQEYWSGLPFPSPGDSCLQIKFAYMILLFFYTNNPQTTCPTYCCKYTQGAVLAISLGQNASEVKQKKNATQEWRREGVQWN